MDYASIKFIEEALHLHEGMDIVLEQGRLRHLAGNRQNRLLQVLLVQHLLARKLPLDRAEKLLDRIESRAVGGVVHDVTAQIHQIGQHL